MIFGWRCYTIVNTDGRYALKGLHNTIWEESTLIAECSDDYNNPYYYGDIYYSDFEDRRPEPLGDRRGRCIEHLIDPNGGHGANDSPSCGIYIVPAREDLLKVLGNTQRGAIAYCSGSGTIARYDLGWRAEEVKIEGIFLTNKTRISGAYENIMNDFSIRYGVPIGLEEDL